MKLFQKRIQKYGKKIQQKSRVDEKDVCVQRFVVQAHCFTQKKDGICTGPVKILELLSTTLRRKVFRFVSSTFTAVSSFSLDAGFCLQVEWLFLAQPGMVNVCDSCWTKQSEIRHGTETTGKSTEE